MSSDKNAAKKLDDERRWSALMKQGQAGDRQSYNQLLSELGRVIEKYILSKFGELTSLEDCIQESLLAIHHARHTYDPRRPFRPWLFTIVHHKTIDILLKGNRHNIESLDQAGLETMEESHVDLDRAIDGERLMFELSDEQRQAITLTKYAGMTTNEASSVLGVTETALKARLKRGLDKIKKQWLVEEANQ